MNTVSADRILENIYGMSATGTIRDNFVGGNLQKDHYVQLYKTNYKSRENIIASMNNIKYVGATTNNISGGVRKKSVRKSKQSTKRRATAPKDIVIYASPEYVKDQSLQLFMDKFFLYYRMSRSPNSAIYIIPSDATLKSMISKRGDGKDGSIELQRSVRQNSEIQWERYFFITFGNNSKTDRYRIDPALTDPGAYPNKEFDEIRRTNLLGEVFYISYKDKDSVYINNKPGQHSGTTLKFVARFNNGGYIFKGDVPKDAIEKIGTKSTTKKLAKRYPRKFNELSFGDIPFVGGRAQNSLDVLQRYDELYNHDHDLAAEHFMRCFANKNTDSKYFGNSDMLFNAIYAAVSNPTAVNMVDIGQEVDKQCFDKMFANYKLVSNVSHDQIKSLSQKINKLYNNVVINKSETKQFVNAVNNIYKNIQDKQIPVVDIMTGYVRQHNQINFNDIYDDIYETLTTDNNNCQACSLINNAMTANMLPSLVGRSCLPIFCSFDGGCFENDMTAGKYNAHDDEPVDKQDDRNIVQEIFQACPKNNDCGCESKQSSQHEPEQTTPQPEQPMVANSVELEQEDNPDEIEDGLSDAVEEDDDTLDEFINDVFKD